MGNVLNNYFLRRQEYTRVLCSLTNYAKRLVWLCFFPEQYKPAWKKVCVKINDKFFRDRSFYSIFDTTELYNLSREKKVVYRQESNSEL